MRQRNKIHNKIFIKKEKKIGAFKKIMKKTKHIQIKFVKCLSSI